MRTILALAMTLVLLSVVALCPAIACPLIAGSAGESGSCCHKPHPGPCPPKTVPDCPYSILQKSKTNPAATHVQWVGSLARNESYAALPAARLTCGAACRLVHAAALFLRNRVLLI